MLPLSIFSSHWKVGSSMNCFFTEGGGEAGRGQGQQIHIFCNNLDPAHRIQTKFGMDILLDPWNKPAKEFFIFLKIQDGRWRSKICDALYLWFTDKKAPRTNRPLHVQNH